MAEQGAKSANQAPPPPRSVKINKKLADLSHTPKPCFFEIHDQLRKENEKAYEPEILSIGPYHRGKKNLRPMEEHKLRCLKLLLKSTEGTSDKKQEGRLKKMFVAMRGLTKKARECYADIPSTLKDDDEFAEMMLLDGCFIIELFRMYKERKSRHHDPESRDEYDSELGDKHDPPSGERHDPKLGEEHHLFSQLNRQRRRIQRDLLLYENQLPFFILVQLLVALVEPSLSEKQLSEPSLSPQQLSEQLSEMALFFFEEMRPSPQTKPSDSQSNIADKVFRPVSESSTIRSARQWPEVLQPLISRSSEVSESSARMRQHTDHDDNETYLLSFIHDSWLPTLSKSKATGNESESPGNESGSPANHGSKFIKCTTELVKTGIKFERAEDITPLLDITFDIKNGVMKIPPLCINDTTECLFRNLIAYERYNLGTRSECVPQRYHWATDYCIFMDRLINSAKDAQELQDSEIINNSLGDDEVIAKVFNKLGNNFYSSEKFRYSPDFEGVNDYCKKPPNRWRASLMRKYFNSPWAILSLLAAIFLLLLTVIQTIFAILPYV